MATTIDRGDRPAATSAVMSSPATLRAMLDAAPDALITVASDGSIVFANTQAEHLFGYARDELLGEALEVLVPESVRHLHQSHRLAYVEHPTSRPMGMGLELAGRRKDGSEFPAEISLSAVETGGGLLVSAAVRDATERRAAQQDGERVRAGRARHRADADQERLEQQLHQAQRLESLGQLAGGVAHDFNNLLAVILNYTSFLGEAVGRAAALPGGQHWHAVGQDVEQVQRAAERASRLTHRLLAFARREVVRPTVLNLNDAIREIEQLLLSSIGEEVVLETALAPDLWKVLADHGQVEQVLLNLAVNARDAMPVGGTLTIESTNIVVNDAADESRGEPRPGRYVRLRVSDTGTGMDRDSLARVFEPFFSTKPKGEGTGLGLATVYGIVRQAGGSSHMQSTPGTGTIFTALFPATDDHAEMPGRTPEAVRPRGGETVLVVEDEEAIREVTRRILVRNGHSVLTACSGADAVDVAEHFQGHIDLLLTDVVMPQMLGKEVAERLTRKRTDLRVLFMSGYAQPVLASKGTLDAGVVLVEKPFSEQSLLEKIREVLDA